MSTPKTYVIIIRLHANSIPIVFWSVFEVLVRPNVLSKVHEIIQSAYDTKTQESESAKLGRSPFLQSIFAEVTRLRVVGIIPKVVTTDFQLGEWSIPKGSMLGLPSQTAAMNGNVWNAGTQEEPHPLNEFWAERFLVYPDKPYSGPLRRPKNIFHNTKQDLTGCSSTQRKRSSEPAFSLQGLDGAYLAFGGGPGMCPGRHFARQEVLCTVSRILLNYDIQLQIPKGWEPKMDMTAFPTGACPPASRVPLRIRRRVT